jgi:putative ABC transport system permease protein
MESLFQDIRYALRQLRKNPGFTAVAVITLGLGIGATTAIFAVVNSVLLQPLPYPQSNRLLMVEARAPGGDFGALSEAVYADYGRRTQVFDHLAAYSGSLGSRLTGTGEPIVVFRCEVTANFWPTLGVTPELGRTFVPQDQERGIDTTVVISDRLWRRHFDANPKIIGASMVLDGRPYIIVGVMPPGFSFPRNDDVWSVAKPKVLSTGKLARYGVIGRLRSGISQQQAQAELDVFAHQFRSGHPQENEEHLRAVPLLEDVVGDARRSLLILLGVVVFVLLIACTNVANLFLARGIARAQELAVRASLGATRSRLVRQLVTESILLSVLGGALGLLMSLWVVRVFVSLVPARDLPRINEIHPDGWVLAFTLVISTFAGLLFGMIPAVQLSKVRLNEFLKQTGSRWGTGSGARLRSALIVGEVSLALVLLIGAGLMVKSFIRLRAVNPGFNSRDLMTMTVITPEGRSLEQLKGFEGQVLDQLRLSGIGSAAAVNWLPFGHAMVESSIMAEGHPEPPGELPIALRAAVSSDYFRTLGIRLLQGRDFTAADNQRGPRVVIVGRFLAKRMWPGQNAVGKRISFDEQPGPEDWLTVVGVAEDVKQNWLGEDTRLTLYQPYSQVSDALFLSQMVFAVRSEGRTGAVAGLMRSRLHQVDKDQPAYAIETMDELIGESIAQPRFYSKVLAGFSLVALLIAAVGIYGVTAFTVNHRTREIGVRMALGAQRRDVLRLVLGEGMLLAGLGILLGVAGALALTRLLESYLYEVKPTDPLAFTTMALLLGAVALMACVIPARRAMRVDPLVALRHE